MNQILRENILVALDDLCAEIGLFTMVPVFHLTEKLPIDLHEMKSIS